MPVSGGPAISAPQIGNSPIIKDAEKLVGRVNTNNVDTLIKGIGADPQASQFQQERNELRANLNKVNADLQASLTRAQQAEINAQATQQLAQETQIRLDNFERNADKTSAQFAASLTELKKLRDEDQAMAAKTRDTLDTALLQLGNAVTQMKALETQISGLETKLAQAYIRIERLEDKVGQQNVTIVALQAMQTKLEQQFAAQATAVPTLVAQAANQAAAQAVASVQAQSAATAVAQSTVAAQATVQAVSTAQAVTQATNRAQSQASTQASTQAQAQGQATPGTGTGGGGGDKGPGAAVTSGGGATTKVVMPNGWCDLPNDPGKQQGFSWDGINRYWMGDRLGGDIKKLGGRCEVHFGVSQKFYLWSITGQITLDDKSVTAGNDIELTGKRLVIVYSPNNDSNGFHILFTRDVPTDWKATDDGALKLPLTASGQSPYGSCMVAGNTQAQTLSYAIDRIWQVTELNKAIKAKGGECTVTFPAARQFTLNAVEGTVWFDDKETRVRDNGFRTTAAKVRIKWDGANDSAGFDMWAIPGPDFTVAASAVAASAPAAAQAVASAAPTDGWVKEASCTPKGGQKALINVKADRVDMNVGTVLRDVKVNGGECVVTFNGAQKFDYESILGVLTADGKQLTNGNNTSVVTASEFKVVFDPNPQAGFALNKKA